MPDDQGAAEKRVLVLQGGGALGSYQAGVYEALTATGFRPNWVAGISIGAINAALIAGNPVESCVERLRTFWERASSTLTGKPLFTDERSRGAFTEVAALSTMVFGVPGFFRPRFPPPLFFPTGSTVELGFYDTAPLRRTLEELVDFDRLNSGETRFSVGAVNVQTGNFTYFDSAHQRIGPEHVMASGALPPGFPPVEIEGEFYWDGGLVSNTPIQYVLDQTQRSDLLIFQVDLFSARGRLPTTLIEAAEREKDIRYSSRTRMNTDVALELHEAKAAVRALLERLPGDLGDHPDVRRLREFSQENAVTVVHLINRRRKFDSSAKDYEFSRVTMLEHWDDGRTDVETTLADAAWLGRDRPEHGVAVFDLAQDGLHREAAPGPPASAPPAPDNPARDQG